MNVALKSTYLKYIKTCVSVTKCDAECLTLKNIMTPYLKR